MCMSSCDAGGGYLYSVCPKTEKLTEECLQAHSLSFVGRNHTIRFLDGRAELQIPATDVSEGTHPKGSAWRMNPIPACNCDLGFACGIDQNDPKAKSYFNGSQVLSSVAICDIHCISQPFYLPLTVLPLIQPTPRGFDCPTGTMFPVPFDFG